MVCMREIHIDVEFACKFGLLRLKFPLSKKTPKIVGIIGATSFFRWACGT